MVMTNVTSKSTVTTRKKNCKRSIFNLFSSFLFNCFGSSVFFSFILTFFVFPCGFCSFCSTVVTWDGILCMDTPMVNIRIKKIPNANNFLRNAFFTFFSKRRIICREAS